MTSNAEMLFNFRTLSFKFPIFAKKANVEAIG